MKKFYLLTFLFLTGIIFTYAQNPIPNPSFETWHGYQHGEQPDFWQTSDSLSMVLGAGHSAVKETSDKCDQLYSIKLTTFTAFFTNIIPGVATNGLITGPASVGGGTPDTVRHAKLTGCVKYAPSGANIAMISAFLFRWNSTSGTRDTIATTVYTMSSAISTITSFQSDFVYQDGRNPDTILVILQSSPGINASNAVSGSVLTVDNLNVAGVVSSVAENNIIKDVKVYPSPAANELHVDVADNHFKNTFYKITDQTGRVVLSGELKEKQPIHVGSLSNGIYMLMLNNESGEKLYSTRVTVAH